MLAYKIPEELLARCAGQPTICKRVVDRYVHQMQEDVPDLCALLQSQEGEAASKLAHRIKGASANVEAAELRQLAFQIEKLTRDGELDEATVLADELKVIWPAYVELTAEFIHP